MKDGVIDIPNYEDRLDAHERIAPRIRRTPVSPAEYLSQVAGCNLFSKCENFQEPEAFKLRSATNAVFGLDDDKAEKGVATHSLGNHGSCRSHATMKRGRPCNVVMPRTAPQLKKDPVRRYGGVITEWEPSTTSREAIFAKVEKATGGNFVHPYNDPQVIAGQRACPKEFMEKTGSLDMFVAPIRGGVMISGTCLTISKLAPETKIITTF